jgi:hypothetical protein
MQDDFILCMSTCENGFIGKRAVAQTEVSSTGSLSRLLPIYLGEAKDQRCQLFEPKGRVLEHAVPVFKQPCATVSANRLEQALDVSKIGSELREKMLGQQRRKKGNLLRRVKGSGQWGISLGHGHG